MIGNDEARYSSAQQISAQIPTWVDYYDQHARDRITLYIAVGACTFRDGNIFSLFRPT